MKLTKIVATIGPSCDSPEMIEALIQAGVNVFRFNFKHNTIEWHNDRIGRVNRIARQMKEPVGTLIDLQGPEIRVNMPKDEIAYEKDELLVFGAEAFDGKKGFSISHPEIIRHLKNGQKVLAEDGIHVFFVEQKQGKTFVRARDQGILKNRKNFNIPGADFPFPVLVERDFEGLKLAQRKEIDYVALSFVRSAQDIKVVRKEMEKFKVKAKIIAKIETEKALKDLGEIKRSSDGIMVARGDLGVEMPMEEVPYYQKLMIKQSINEGIPVITATQMLQSMIEDPQPTRAEISDIANATYDLTDAVMLSGETATGRYPEETVRIMAKTVAFNEKKNLVDSRKRFQFSLNDQEAILCDTAYGLHITCRERKLPIAGFLVFTHTRRTVRML